MHTQSIVPSSALQQELKKKERLEQMTKDAEEAADGEGVLGPQDQGEAAAQTAAESPESLRHQ